jgi:hypothetical protein
MITNLSCICFYLGGSESVVSKYSFLLDEEVLGSGSAELFPPLLHEEGV